jgi:hypothetical protein
MFVGFDGCKFKWGRTHGFRENIRAISNQSPALSLVALFFEIIIRQ